MDFSRRCFSIVLSLRKSDALDPVFRSSHLKEVGRTFDKNFPIEKRPKPWEEKGLSKDLFFMKKYGSVNEEQRNAINRKVERQRRARKMRETHESLKRMNTDKIEKEQIKQPLRNPLSEYVYGTFPVTAALLSRKRELFNKIYVHNSKESMEKIFKQAKKYGISIDQSCNKSVLNSLSNNGVHNGVILETRPLQLPMIASLDECNPDLGTYKINLYNDLYDTRVEKSQEVTRNCRSGLPKFPLGIYLDGLTDPQNVGAVIRSAYFMGVDFIVVPDHDSAKLGPVTNKASSGALDMMEIYKTSDVLNFVDNARNNGWTVISASAKPKNNEEELLKYKHHKVQQSLAGNFIDANDLNSIMLQSPILFILGSEGEGIRTNLKLKSDFLVCLEKNRYEEVEVVDSLNVSVATGVLISKCFE